MQYFLDILGRKKFTELPIENGFIGSFDSIPNETIRQFVRVWKKKVVFDSYQPTIDIVVLSEDGQNTTVELITYETDWLGRPIRTHYKGLFDEGGNPLHLDDPKYADSSALKTYLENTKF